MAGSRGAISLTDLLIRLLDDHVPKEVAYQEALHQHTKDSRYCGDELEGDPPIWERTAWDTAVRWLARKSAYFHSLSPDDCFDEDPIDTFERLLREHLTDVKGGGPTQSNPVAAELLEFDQQHLVAALCEELGDDLPPDLKEKLASHADTATQGSLVSVEFQSASPNSPTSRELGSGQAKPKQRGRPKADYETERQEAKIAADWRQARNAGVYKRDFAKDCGMTVAKLDALLDRVAWRNRASE